MIEVFKTNINCADKATQLVEHIHETFAFYRANFDLNDCDRILRVVSGNNNIKTFDFIEWLETLGCKAEILPDN
jgi:hypothetical protein